MRRPNGLFFVPGAWLRAAGAAVIAGAVVVACSSGGPAASGAGQSVAAATENPSAETSGGPAGPSMPDATGVPTTLDPCQLVTAQEASQIAGATFTAGTASTTEGNGKICTYGAQTTNVFMVIVGQAPDVATAQAQEAAAEAAVKAQAAGSPITTTHISGVGDSAVFLSLSETVGGKTISGSAIYVLKGTVFFGFSDINVTAAAPSQATMTALAQTALSRVP